MFESYPIQDCQHFWTARASGLKEETGFLEAPAEARGSRALRGGGRQEICQSVRTRSWSNGRERCKVFLFQIMPSCNGCIGAGGRSNGRECARTVKSVAPRCRAAKLVPPLSTPDQLTCQDQWDRGSCCCCVGSRRRREVGEAPSLGL